MATIKIKAVTIGASLKTILSEAIGSRCIVSEIPLSGPQGGSGWMELTLSDGEIVLVGEKMFSWRPIPKWVLNRHPKKRFVSAGGGDRWRAYISGMDVEGCTCQHCGRVYRVDFIVPDDMWEHIRPSGSDVGGGMLCGRCISDRIEALYRRKNMYGKFDIT